MIAEYLFKTPRILILLLVAIAIAGVNSFLATPRLEDPVLGKRVGVISVAFPGSDVLQVESLITLPIEELLNGVPEIKQVRSNTRSGIANIVIELRDDVTEVDPVWVRIQNDVEGIRSELPESILTPQFEVFPLRAYAAIVAIKSRQTGDPDLAILSRIANRLRSEILSFNGTETIKVFGDPGEEFVAEIEPQTLAATGLSTAAIAGQVAKNLALQPGGNVGGDDGEVMVGVEQFSMPEEKIGLAKIQYGRGESASLSQIARIERRTVDPPQNLALIDKRNAIVLGVLVDNNEQVDRWSSQFENAVEKIQKQFDNDVDVEVLFSQSTHVHNRMLTLSRNLAIGSAAVALVVFVLMGWRSMIVVALALPVSALMVMSGMRLLAIPIHQMSVTGLIVALGLLIDNAIVMVDEVRAKMLQGDSRLAAIAKAVRHLQMPLLGSTLTTVLAFWPIATLPGPAGEFVGTIAISVILAICSSFILAMTLIPAACALLEFGEEGRQSSRGLSAPLLKSAYEKSLGFVFRYPILGVLLGLALPLAGFLVATQLPIQFFPPSDRSQIQIEVELPAREGLARTRSSVERIYDIVGQNPTVTKQHWFLGQSAPTFYYNVVPRKRGTRFYAQAIIDVQNGVSTGGVVRQLQKAIDSSDFSSRVIVRQLQQGPPFDAPIEVRVVGTELVVLEELGNQLRKLLSETGNVIHTRSDHGDTTMQLALKFDAEAMASNSLSESQVMGQIYTTLEGASAGNIVDSAGMELPVMVKMVTGEDSRLDLIKAIPFPTSNRAQPPSTAGGAQQPPGGPGTSQPAPSPTLGNLAEFDFKSGSGAIVHVDGVRVNEVKAYIQAGVLPSVVLNAFKKRLAESDFELPAGYELQFGGETEQRSNAVNSLIANGVLLFALMLLSLVASFRSFRCALIIAIVGGLSVGLGPLALWIFGYPFGFMAIVGTMGLVGVAINDSIVVLAAIRANQAAEPESQLSLTAVVSSCTRHIIATTLTTIVGFLPLIVGGGGFWPPLAITIAGGVGGATFLALYIVPSWHLLLFSKTSSN